jgi:hypothetical protein
MCAGPFLCIALAIVGITAESRESGRMGGHPHVQMLSPPPFVGVVLVCICGSGRLMSVHNPTGSTPAVHCTSFCVCMSMSLFPFLSLLGGVGQW